jgi:TalC/MipB family fructose-6-phosphate aldolase
MQIWLDTIDCDLIENANRLGIVAGVTTNPRLLSQANADPAAVIKKLLDIQPGRVAVQTTAKPLPSIIEQAYRLVRVSDRIIVKIPAVGDGLRAIALLAKEGIPTVATTIYETRQIVWAAKLGATYAAPYLGRIALAGGDALAVVRDAQQILATYCYPTHIMAAAIRTAGQFVECAKAGVGAATLSADLYQALFASNAFIDASLNEFDRVWLANTATAQAPLFDTNSA